MEEYHDTLEALNKTTTLSEKLRYTHSVLQSRYGFIARVAVAIYDPKTDLLKTFIHSSGDDHPLNHYQAKLSEASSLKDLLQTNLPRIVNDLDVFKDGRHEHSRRIAEQGYGSSYTMPMHYNGDFFGFIFFNSYEKNCFHPRILHDLDLFGHLISLLIISELTNFRTMLATVKAVRDITYHRDMETGAHIDRMAHYSRLISRELAERHRFSDEFIEHVFLFAPLHDIGKIGLPDSILRKPKRLSGQEFEVVKGHTLKGRQIIDSILQDFGLEGMQQVDILRNIAEYHHEAINGTGYPHGIQDQQIPIEAKISAVADIFDALTSKRPYKDAWGIEESFNLLRELAGTKLDKECVEALIKNREEVEKIQALFKEEPYG